MNHAIIQTEGLRFAYAEEGAVNPFVLDGVSLDLSLIHISEPTRP